jgi:hypothetical protein
VVTSRWHELVRTAGRFLRRVPRRARAQTPLSSTRGARPSPAGPHATRTHPPYPGDFTGVLHPRYIPDLDGAADPGEVVWTWVPYEDDPTRGKDRPVLIVGYDEPWVLGLMLTSKDHDHDAADEARWGRRWLDVGAGPWDARRRPSEVRLDRVIRVDPDAIRREGAIMDRKAFGRVIAQL